MAKTKEERIAHRQAHHTDADRALNKQHRGDQKGRRAARAQDFADNAVDNVKDFDTDKYGKGHVSGQEIKAMREQGFSKDDIAAKVAESGSVVGGNAQKRLQRWSDAKERANTNLPQGDVQPVQPPQQGQIPPGTKVDNSVDNSFGVGGDLNQNVGKKGDTNTTIGDNNTIGHGATIGGDYSVTIGGNSAGNGQQSGGQGASFGFNNMQLAGSYNALNENAYHRSSAQLNGAGSAAGASAQAAETTGATDRVANLYNAIGSSQNYWSKKSDAQSVATWGDIFAPGFGGGEWKMPSAPAKIEDNTEEIYNDSKEEIKNI